MANANDELLLKISSDVSAARAGIEQVVNGLGNLNKTGTVLQSTLAAVGQASQVAERAFGHLQMSIIAIDSALNLASRGARAIVGTLGALNAASRGSAENFGSLAEQLTNVSQQAGVSMRTYQALSVRLKDLGLGSEAAIVPLRMLSVHLRDAYNGGTQASELFRSLGTRFQDSSKQMRPLNDVLMDVARQFAAMPSSAQKTALAVETFGRMGSQIIPLLNEIGRSSGDLSEDYRILSDRIIEVGNAYGTESDRIEAATTAIRRQLGSVNAEINLATQQLLGDALTKLAEFVTSHRQAIVETAKAIEVLAAGVAAFGSTYAVARIGSLILAFLRWRSVIGAAVEAFAGLRAAIALTAAAQGVMAGGMTGLTAAFVLLRSGIVAAAGALRTYLVAQTALMGPFGIAAVAAALAAAGAAWLIYGRNAEEAAEKVEGAAVATTRAAKLEQMRAMYRDILPMAPGPERDKKLEQYQALIRSLGGAIEYSREQVEDLRTAEVSLTAAQSAAEVARVRRTQGVLAGIEAERQATLNAQKEEFEHAKQLAVEADKERGVRSFGDLSPEKRSTLARLNQIKIDEIETEFRAKREQAEVEHQQTIRAISITESEKTGIAKLTAAREADKQLREQNLITQTELLARERLRIDEEYKLNQAAMQRRIAAEIAGSKEQAQLRQQLSDLDRQHTQKLEENTTAQVASIKQRTDAQRQLTEQVQSLEAQAFGTEAEQRIQQLQTAQAGLIKRLTEQGGMEDAIERVRASYARMISDAQAGTIDLTSTIKTGIEDAFSGVILGTRKMSDVFDAFKQSMVKQFVSGFADVILEKARFDSKIHLNFTRDIPASAAQGAQSVGNVWGSVFNLLSGGSGVGPQVSVSPGGGAASFIGGIAPQAASAVAQGTAGQAAGVSRLAASGYTASQIASLQGGALAGTSAGVPAASGFNAGAALSGLGGAAGTLGAGALLSFALSGGSGPLGPIGPLGSLAALAATPATAGAVAGLVSPFASVLGGAANAVGLGGLASSVGGFLGIGGAAGGATAATGGIIGATSTNALGLTGAAAGNVGALAAPVATAASTALSIIPVIGWALAGIAASLSASQWADSTNKGLRGASGIGDKEVYQAFWSGAIGKSLGKGLGPFLGSALTGFLPTDKMGFDPMSDFLKSTGVLHTPSGHTQGARFFRAFSTSDKSPLKDAITFGGQYPERDIMPKDAGKHSELLGGKAYGYRGKPEFEKQRDILEAIGAVGLARTFPEGAAMNDGKDTRPYPIANIHEFASAYIDDAERMKLSTQQFEREVDELLKAAGGTLPEMIQQLSTLLDPKFMYQTRPTAGEGTAIDLYADSVAALTDAMVEDLPNAAVNAIREIARQGKVEVDELTTYIENVVATSELASESLKRMVEAATPDPNLAKRREQERRAAEEQRWNTEQQIKGLAFSIMQAREFGDEIAAGQLAMQRDSLQLSLNVQREAEKILSPQEQFLQTIKQGLRGTVVDAVVSGLVDAGMIQVALEPIIAKVRDLMPILSDPNATAEQINAGLAEINAVTIAQMPVITRMAEIFEQLMTSPAMQQILNLGAPTAMAEGFNGVISKPTLALIGEAGPEMVNVRPINRPNFQLPNMNGPSSSVGGNSYASYGAPVTLTININGGAHDDMGQARRYADEVGNHLMRQLKQNRAIG